MGSPVPGSDRRKAVAPLLPNRKRRPIVNSPKEIKTPMVREPSANPVDDKIVRTMPITLAQLGQIKKAYRIK
jgi:hypothetical protein